MTDRDSFDICITGAGVIGLAIAYAMATKYKGNRVSILLLEQEQSFGQHTSSRNSEVIHAGIYYPPDSLKAKFCAAGKEMLYAYCKRYAIPHRQTGKLIVANKEQAGQLDALMYNAACCDVLDLEMITAVKLKELEPELRADLALFSPSSGIIDSHSYMQSLLHQSQMLGVQFSPLTRVEHVLQADDGLLVQCSIDDRRQTERYEFECRHFINSAGLGAQKLSESIEGVCKESIPMLHFCKGNYFDYQRRNPFSHLIYPLPEANTAGLGIHATMDLSSRLKFGPDAEYVDCIDFAVDENKREDFAARVSKYFPRIRAEDLQPAYSGIRPKLSAVGEPAADYVIQSREEHGVSGLTQLFGMESPGLTSSLAIGEYVVASLEL